MTVKEDTPLTEKKLTPEQKAAGTHREAMRIIDAEAAARQKKTARLRHLRLEREAGETVSEDPKPKTRTKVKRGRS